MYISQTQLTEFWGTLFTTASARRVQNRFHNTKKYAITSIFIMISFKSVFFSQRRQLTTESILLAEPSSGKIRTTCSQQVQRSLIALSYHSLAKLNNNYVGLYRYIISLLTTLQIAQAINDQKSDYLRIINWKHL